MTDLLAAVITLEAQAAGEPDPFQGRAMHALFLDLLARADPGRAQALHDADELKPFTSSNLIGLHALVAENSNRAAVCHDAGRVAPVVLTDLSLAGRYGIGRGRAGRGYGSLDGCGRRTLGRPTVAIALVMAFLAAQFAVRIALGLFGLVKFSS